MSERIKSRCALELQASKTGRSQLSSLTHWSPQTEESLEVAPAFSLGWEEAAGMDVSTAQSSGSLSLVIRPWQCSLL